MRAKILEGVADATIGQFNLTGRLYIKGNLNSFGAVTLSLISLISKRKKLGGAKLEKSWKRVQNLEGRKKTSKSNFWAIYLSLKRSV